MNTKHLLRAMKKAGIRVRVVSKSLIIDTTHAQHENRDTADLVRHARINKAAVMHALVKGENEDAEV
jgi:hypothetical protein